MTSPKLGGPPRRLGETVPAPADLILASHRRHRPGKRALHEQHGVEEYWPINPEAQAVEVLQLERGESRFVGCWRPTERTASRLPKGFQVPVAELLGVE